MTKICVICKAVPSPISNRSFHMFPKCESVRKKWVDVLNVSKTLNYKNACVCSDHFDKESYFPSDEFRQKQRLRPEAVPDLKKVSENVTKSIDNSEVSHVIGDVSLKIYANGETERSTDKVSATHFLNFEECNIPKDISLQSHQDEKIELRTEEMSLRDPLDLEESNENPDGCDTETVDSFEPKNNSTISNDESDSKKRKNSLTDVRPVKRVRFMIGFRTEYIRREDFVDDEAWNRFLKFLSYKNSKLAAARNKNSRKNKKIQSWKGVIDILQRKK